ncbi:MAG TPA: glutamyl-tRNA reductase [Candidatus Nitrosotenuis sp.]|nr:glutamyl-tRNA reductase [Candidatus Nitrosotenuis sp.]
MSKDNFKVINIRVTFKNIPIHKIEKFSFKDVAMACETFKKIPGISECVIVQTASRVEIFTVNSFEGEEVPDARRDEGKGLVLNKIKETWVSLTQLDQYDIDHFDQILEVYMNTDVYLHLLRLASGLDSITVGNETILEELKAAISSARQAETSGKILNRLFDSSIRIATRIREATGISKGVVSIGNIAVKIAEENAGLDAKKHVLIVGTGETAAMVAKALKKKGYPFDVSSMFIERATGFSKILGGKPVAFKDVISGFNKFDIIFVATTADYFVISYDKVRIVMESKKSGTMILDISDPRSVDENISSLPGIKLMFRDQITEMEERNLKEKEEKIIAVEKMIAKEIPIIEATIKLLGPEPQVSEVFASVDALRKKELEKALQKLGETDEEKIKIIDELTRTVVESIVSIPAKSPKKASE